MFLKWFMINLINQINIMAKTHSVIKHIFFVFKIFELDLRGDTIVIMYKNKLVFIWKFVKLLYLFNGASVLFRHFDKNIIPMDSRFSSIPLLKSLFLCLIVKKVDFDIIKYTYRTLITILSNKHIFIA